MAKKRLLLLLFGVLVVFAAACGGDDDDDDGDGGGGGDNGGDGGDDAPLVIVRDMDLNSLDPHRAYCDTCQIYLSAVYQTLIGLDPEDNQSFVPRLATEWGVNDDSTEYTFTLNGDATFSDGSAVEAKDVKWSWERLANVKGSAAYFMDGVENIEAGDGTVTVTLAAPDSAFLAKVNAPYAAIVNSDVAIENGANADADADQTDTAEPWFLENSAGSGPYMLESYTEGDELRLVRNDNFWGDAPELGVVILKQTKDAVTQRQLLEAGDADIAMQIDPDTAADISDENVTTEQVPSFNFVYIALSPGAAGNTVELTDEVREAIKLAIDYEGIIEVTVGGAGRTQAAAIPNGFLGTADLPKPARDLDRAKELLEEAGHPDGFEIDAAYPNVNVYGVDFNTMMQKVQADLAEAGITVNLQPLEFSVWVDQIRGDGIPLTAVYFAPDHTDTIQYLQYFGMVEGAVWLNRAWGDKAAERANEEEARLGAEALATTDVEEKEELYRQMGEQMISDLIHFPLVNPDLILAYRSNLQGMHYSACCNLEIWRLSRE